ncbi:hypothetical protein WN48_10937 [Eufriesea mexicana]|uniref:Uncharacterized protein n=1 Tax=Eufriesea mexicana TaxID=516756 RepID=A0A310SHV9_9HYME|nr:hypothetical protein WN48_10937 [Eufriesea mexicana]
MYNTCMPKNLCCHWLLPYSCANINPTEVVGQHNQKLRVCWNNIDFRKCTNRRMCT